MGQFRITVTSPAWLGCLAMRIQCRTPCSKWHSRSLRESPDSAPLRRWSNIRTRPPSVRLLKAGDSAESRRNTERRRLQSLPDLQLDEAKVVRPKQIPFLPHRRWWWRSWATGRWRPCGCEGGWLANDSGKVRKAWGGRGEHCSWGVLQIDRCLTATREWNGGKGRLIFIFASIAECKNFCFISRVLRYPNLLSHNFLLK